MMRKMLLFFAAMAGFALHAQLRPALQSEIFVQADFFCGMDNLGALYYIKDNVFFKQQQGRVVQYQNLSLGRIDRADLLNPMNIVLFYKDFNAVVFLDNQLNEIRQVRFSDFQQPLVVTATGNAAQNRIWVFNSLDQQLGLFDYLKKTYMPLAQPFKNSLVHYETDFNHFFWIDELGDRYGCDLFGKVTAYGKWPAAKKMQGVSPSSALYLSDGKIYYFTLDGNTAPVVDLGEKSPLGFWYGAQNLAIFTSEGISIYKLKLP